MSTRACKHCGERLPVGKRVDAEFCDSTCRARHSEETLTAARKPLTQRDRVLFALREAGGHGLRSDVFLAISISRAAARVKELRDEGHHITSEPEGQFCRYVLHDKPLVGSSAEGRGQASESLTAPANATSGTASGESSADVPLLPDPAPAEPARVPSPRSSLEEQRSSNPQAPGSNPGGGARASRGVARRSTNEHAGCEDNPITGGIARRPARTEAPGDKSEVPAAEPDNLLDLAGLNPDQANYRDPDQRAA